MPNITVNKDNSSLIFFPYIIMQFKSKTVAKGPKFTQSLR